MLPFLNVFAMIGRVKGDALMDVLLDGNGILEHLDLSCTGRDEVEFAWRWIDEIIDGWKTSGQPVEGYVAGTWGPTASSLMLDRDNRNWFPN